MFQKKNSSFLVVFALSLLLYTSKGVCLKGDNVIMMIPDGCDASVQTLARFVKGEE